jgi:hypothetical protein
MYYLVWNKEVIEENIETKEEALYLKKEYSIAYGGIVTIKKDK